MAALNDKCNCSICLNRFTTPRIIDCHHTFCETCLDDYINKFTVDKKFDCPICRRAVCVPENGAQGFAINFYFDDLSEVVTKSEKPVDICQRHHEDSLDESCSDSSEEIYYTCVEDHQDHNIEDLQEDQSTLTKEVNQLLRGFEERISEIQGYADSVEIELTEYDDATKSVCGEVDKHVQQICEAAKKLGDHFKSQLRRTKTIERTKLVKILKKKQSDIYNIQSSLVYTKEMMKNNSVVNSNDAIKRLMTLKTETKCESPNALPSLNTGSFIPGCICIDQLYQLLGQLSNSVDDGAIQHAFDLRSIRLYSSKWFYSVEQRVKNTRWRMGLKYPPHDNKSILMGLSYEGGGYYKQMLCTFTVDIWIPSRQRLLSYPSQKIFSCNKKEVYVLPKRVQLSTSETWTIRVRINRIDKYYEVVD